MMAREITAAVELMRTDEERRDEEKSWRRPDRAFFAAGACHILAFTFMEVTPEADTRIMFIKPTDDSIFGMHVFAAQQDRALDFNGWSHVDELIVANLAACQNVRPDCEFDVVEIRDGLETFCERNRHRRPSEFFGDPIQRATLFLEHILRT